MAGPVMLSLVTRAGKPFATLPAAVAIQFATAPNSGLRIVATPKPAATLAPVPGSGQLKPPVPTSLPLLPVPVAPPQITTTLPPPVVTVPAVLRPDTGSLLVPSSSAIPGDSTTPHLFLRPPNTLRTMMTGGAPAASSPSAGVTSPNVAPLYSPQTAASTSTLSGLSSINPLVLLGGAAVVFLLLSRAHK
jgi:hypothetical protein